MKKKLEAELISIAHRVLQLKNKSDVEILFQETQKLYEKLAVLRFVENQFGDTKPTLGQTDWEAFFESALTAEEEVAPKKAAKKSKTPLDLKQENPEIIAAFVAESEKEEDTNAFEITEAAAQAQHEEDSAETQVEAEMPQEISFEAVTEVPSEISIEEEEPTAAPAQISFEDLLGANYAEPEFVKPSATEAIEEEQHEIESTEEAAEAPLETPFFSLDEEPELVLELPSTEAEDKKEEITPLFALTADEPKIAAETPAKGFVIGLNDRVGFIHQLFDGSPEDYNRVLSQLMTYHTFEEADAFIRDMVKPDYNNWEGKSEYEERFMDVVARKFQ
ncbi:MAG: hypothetical protein KA325_06240 [Flavobacterium sp.]|nr:hypothetical protein [Flavobacterium sp.]